MDAIYTFNDYSQDSRPRLQFPTRTGRQTSYKQWLDHQFQLHHDESLPPAEADRPLAPTFINHGRWLWLCPACLTAVQVSETAGVVDPCCCPACFYQGFVQPTFPENRAAIDAELMRQPGYRWNAPFRNWEPGWSLTYLQERTAAAQAQLDAGIKFVRAASIGIPRTWSVGELLTAANMNTYVREIQKDLRGDNGPVEFLNAIVPESLTTAERNALTQMNGMMLYNSTAGSLQFFEQGGWTTRVGTHMSQLFAASRFITVQHTLGVKPVIFQLMYERVRDTTHGGHTLGAQIFVANKTSDTNPGFQVYEVTDQEYKVVLPGTNSLPSEQKASFVGHDFTAPNRITVDNDPDSSIASGNGGWGARIISLG